MTSQTEDTDGTAAMYALLGVNTQHQSNDSAKMARARAVLLAGDVSSEDPGDILHRLQHIIDDDAAIVDEVEEVEDYVGTESDTDGNAGRRAIAPGRQVHFTDISVDKYIGFTLAVPAVTHVQYTSDATEEFDQDSLIVLVSTFFNSDRAHHLTFAEGRCRS